MSSCTRSCAASSSSARCGRRTCRSSRASCSLRSGRRSRLARAELVRATLDRTPPKSQRMSDPYVVIAAADSGQVTVRDFRSCRCREARASNDLARRVRTLQTALGVTVALLGFLLFRHVWGFAAATSIGRSERTTGHGEGDERGRAARASVSAARARRSVPGRTAARSGRTCAAPSGRTAAMRDFARISG